MQRNAVEAVIEQKHSQNSLRSSYRLEDCRNTDEAEEEVRHGKRRQPNNSRSFKWLELGAASATADPLTTASSTSQHRQTDGVTDRTERQDARDRDAVDETADVVG